MTTYGQSSMENSMQWQEWANKNGKNRFINWCYWAWNVSGKLISVDFVLKFCDQTLIIWLPFQWKSSFYSKEKVSHQMMDCQDWLATYRNKIATRKSFWWKKRIQDFRVVATMRLLYCKSNIFII